MSVEKRLPSQSVGPSGPVQIMPRMLGRYELLSALGRGGMATVYLARHRAGAGFERLFAIKVLHPHLSDDEEFVNMLLDEARIAALLHHPNVVPILDLGSQEGLHYVVMEYVEGYPLSALLRKYRDQRSPRILVSVLLDALAGLHAAHTLTDDAGVPLNLVHRDVSPQNVMVGVDGTARLTDFGIARAESRIMSTRPGQLKGKIAFMSPEQIRGADKLDARSDLFSFTAMMWSALTGRRLFLADSDAATLSNILNMPIPPASTIGSKPPPELDAVMERGLARNPKDRFQSALELEEALREAATRAGCLGTAREVGAWVFAGFGDELAERRALKASMSHDVTSGIHPVAATPSSPTLPTPSSPHDLALPTSGLTPAETVKKRRPVGLLAAAGVAVVIAVGAGAVFAGRTALAGDPSPPAPVASAPSEPVATAPAKAPPRATPAAEPVAPPPVAPAEAEDRPARPRGRYAGPAPQAAAPPPSAPPPPAPAPTAPPASPAPTAKKWSNDSPLPPQ